MCAIAVICHANPAIDLEAVVKRMTRVQRHRGPDRSAVGVYGRVAMGHARLRVIDLSERADQPFRSAGHEEVLVYNGEIYNFRELRLQLEAERVEFESSSDTEVLFHALRLWGVRALDRLEGMFAFAWYSPTRRELLLARDPIGIKPLCVAFVPGGLLASSEVKGILASGLTDIAIDDEALHQIWRFNHTLSTKTAFRGVEVLSPGSSMLVRLDDLSHTERRYFRPSFRPSNSRNYAERVAELDAAFRRSVASHVVADLPVSCYLSGGIDSSGIASEAHRLLGDRLTTYSMVFPGVPYNEEATVDRFTHERRIPNRKVPITGARLGEYVSFVLAVEMPQWWTSDFALMRLASGVADARHRVVLAGEGPDEFLAGYDAYRAMRVRSIAQRLGAARVARLPMLRSAALRKIAPWQSFGLDTVLHYLSGHDPARHTERRRHFGFYPENVVLWELLDDRHPGLLSTTLRQRRADFLAREASYFAKEIGAHVEGLTELEQNLLFEISVRLPNWVLHMGDRVSAAYGLELRFPYLDKSVVDVMLGLPETDRLRGLTDKRILRSVHAARLPRWLTKRPKQPLYTPVLEWVRTFFDDPEFTRYWNEPLFQRVGLFDWKSSEALRQRLDAGSFESELDKMSSEWAFMTALSAHVLDDRMRELVRSCS